MVKSKRNYGGTTRSLRFILKKRASSYTSQQVESVEFVWKSAGTLEVYTNGVLDEATYIHQAPKRQFVAYLNGKRIVNGSLALCKTTIKAEIVKRNQND